MWTETKIQPAIVDSTAAGTHHMPGLRADARELIARVADASKRICVFVHMYSGDQKTETLKVRRGPTVPSSEFRCGAYTLPTDTLVTVTGQGER